MKIIEFGDLVELNKIFTHLKVRKERSTHDG